jgi:DNA/RNA endonuclease YhcR with UshA esterase domain
LGRGENSRTLSFRRLESARLYLVEPGRIKRENVVFAEGERVDSDGRVEFYLGSKLILVSLAERGKNVCLTCCDDYIPSPKRNRVKRKKG